MDRISCFDEIRRVLPSQGPLEFFVHHNTFHCFEDIPFKDAIKQGQLLYEGNVLKPEMEYFSDFKKGKINKGILIKQIRELCFDSDIHDERVRLFVQELFLNDIKRRVKNPFLRKEFRKIHEISEVKNKFFHHHLLNTYNIDLDEIISPLLFRFFSFYFDQGVAYWKMPRCKDLLTTFRSYYEKASLLSPKWEKQLAKVLLSTKDFNAEETIDFLLEKQQLSEYAHEYLLELSLRYKGWGGLVLSFEKHPEWNKRKDIHSRFEEFAAILMICESAYLSSLNHEKIKDLNENKVTKVKKTIYSLDFLAKAQRLSEEKYSDLEFKSIERALQKLTDFDRCFLWHQAFEETFYRSFLTTFNGYQEHAKKPHTETKLQVFCCLDDREESFRRHLEALGQDIETFGVAGHFGLDIEYKGIFNAHYRALCPDIIRPTKRITEKLQAGDGSRKLYGYWAQYLWLQSLSSKTLVRGLFLQAAAGLVSIFSLSLSVLSPYQNFRIGEVVKSNINKNIKTQLDYDDSSSKGLNFEQMLSHAAGVLQTVGLIDNFAPVVAILGHGSHSLNNPHEAAHDCGACGGGRGAPNARLMATLLNRQDVRSGLVAKGIQIPQETLFIGGYHNTCSDEVLFFDVPEREDVSLAIKTIRKAARRDALERCRKYEDVSLGVSEDKAYLHCLGRANDYMQPRPEYGHATNALCFVGPRWMSRNLFLDRRAFLTSYEPQQDPEANILTNILSAVGPVCSGINLEYYFSFMDNEVYGCGTKLPHNVTSLVGVMNGYQSDLLMGLPWQMVEIHDPYRLMLLVVSTKEKMEKLITEIESLNKLVKNSWIHIAIYDPEKRQLLRFVRNQFLPFQTDFSNAVFFEDSLSPFKETRESCPMGIVRT